MMNYFVHQPLAAGYFPQQTMMPMPFPGQGVAVPPSGQQMGVPPPGQQPPQPAHPAETYDAHLMSKPDEETEEITIYEQVPKMTYETVEVAYQEQVFETATQEIQVPRITPDGRRYMETQQQQYQRPKTEMQSQTVTAQDGTPQTIQVPRPVYETKTRTIQVPKMTYEEVEILFKKRKHLYNQPGIWLWFLSHVQRETGREAGELYHYHNKTNNQRQQSISVTCWLDVKMPDKGFGAMLEGVELSRVFICILSDGYFKSDFCIKELEHALLKKKPIVLCFQRGKKNLAKDAKARYPKLKKVPVVELIMNDPDFSEVTYEILSERAKNEEKNVEHQNKHEEFMKEQAETQAKWMAEQGLAGLDESTHGFPGTQQPRYMSNNPMLSGYGGGWGNGYGNGYL